VLQAKDAAGISGMDFYVVQQFSWQTAPPGEVAPYLSPARLSGVSLFLLNARGWHLESLNPDSGIEDMNTGLWDNCFLCFSFELWSESWPET
jgi:hypothetical protein